MFIGYAINSAAYIFPPKCKVERLPPSTNKKGEKEWSDNKVELKSKRRRKETFFGNDNYIFLPDNDPLTYEEAMSSRDASR